MRSRTTSPDLIGLGALALLLGALVVAVGLRSAPLFADFPIVDGGLFWVMANELRDAQFIPPEFTGYNLGDIPWMYPPLGLVLVGLVGGGTDWLRFLPALFAVATLPAFWLLARSLVGTRAAFLALVAYGLAPAAYQGLLSGGGVTRGPGMVLALLTMWAVVERRPVPAGILGGLVLLTHPLAASYTAIGSVALWATRGAHRSMLVAPIVALAIGAAWFLPMTMRHGVDSLLSGLGSRGGFDPMGSAVLFARLVVAPPTLASIAGLVGVVIAWRRRRWDLIAWLAVTALGVGVTGRWAIVPMAVLAGLAMDRAIAELPSRRSVAFAGIVAIAAVVGIVLTEPERPISVAERETMTWVGDHTPIGATVAVIGYPADGGVVEWFPALSERRNVTTAQGSEWEASGNRWDEARAATQCRSLDCLPEADYFVLRPGCCDALAADLQEIGPNVFERRP